MREFVGKFGRTQNFAIPVFGDRKFKVNRSVTETILRQASETTYVEEPSQSFKAKIGCEGAMYAEWVEWVSPTGANLIRNVLINAKIYIGTIWGKLLHRNLSNFKDPLGFSKTVFYQNHIISRRFSKLFF